MICCYLSQESYYKQASKNDHSPGHSGHRHARSSPTSLLRSSSSRRTRALSLSTLRLSSRPNRLSWHLSSSRGAQLKLIPIPHDPIPTRAVLKVRMSIQQQPSRQIRIRRASGGEFPQLRNKAHTWTRQVEYKLAYAAEMEAGRVMVSTA
jgi:hypothetical protein